MTRVDAIEGRKRSPGEGPQALKSLDCRRLHRRLMISIFV